MKNKGKNPCCKAHRTLFIVGVMIMFIGILPNLTSAELTFNPNEPADIKMSCFGINDNYCAAGVECNITVLLPNMSVLVDNQVMTNQESYYNYTTDSLTERGEYNSLVLCDDGSAAGYTTFTFVVTGIPATSQGNVAVGILLSLVAVGGLFTFIGFKFIGTDKTFPIALFFIAFALIISVYAIYLGFIYSRDILVSSLAMGGQQTIFIGALFGFTAIIFIAMLYLIVKTLGELKERKSLIKYGANYDTKKKMYKGN